MNREMLVEHLALAKVEVADDELAIAQQKQLISELNRDGHATLGAEQFLHALEITHALHVACRNHAQRELTTAIPEWEYRPTPRFYVPGKLK